MRTTLALVTALAFIVTGQKAWAATDFYSTGPGTGAPDGLDDVWQQIYNAWNLTTSGDADNDGCSNLIECIAATNPFVAGDCLKVGNTVITGANVIFTVDAEAGKKYTVQESDAPNGTFVDVIAAGQSPKTPTADNASETITITKPVGPLRKFYKIKVEDVDTDGDGVSDWAEGKTGMNPAIGSSTGNGASDGDTLHSMLSLSAAPTVANGFERNDKYLGAGAVAVPAKIGLTRSFGTMALNGITMSGVGSPPDATKGSASVGDYAALGTVNIPASAGVPRAQRLDEGHHLSLVVHRSARHDARPVRTVHHHRLERRALPQFKRIGRLHVVVPIEKHARRGHALRSRMRRNHHRVAKRGHRVCLEADLAQLRHQPFSAASHIRGEGRVGAHCGDAKERLQALHGLGVVGVGSGKHAVQRCLHARQPIAERPTLRALNPRSVGSPHAA
jgi:hypothetical protein